MIAYHFLAIRLVCPRARICVSPILPSKIPIINESALAFNQLLFKHIQSEAKPSITSVDLNCFLDHRSGCLRTELGRYMSSDPFHLGRDGYRLLANVFKDMILGASYGLNRRASGAGFRPDTGGSGRGNTRVSGSVSGRGSGGSSRRSHPVTPLHYHSEEKVFIKTNETSACNKTESLYMKHIFTSYEMSSPSVFTI